MSALDVFTKRAWFRRLWILAVGILLGLGYFYNFIVDLYVTPALIGFLIGLLSAEIIGGVMSSLIIMFGMIGSILVIVLAGNLGSGDKIAWETYQNWIAGSFVAGAMPMLSLVPAVVAGFIVRQIFIKLRERERTQ